MLINTELRQFPWDKNLAQSFCKDQLYVTQNIYSTLSLLNTEIQNNWGWYLWRSLSVPPCESRVNYIRSSGCTRHDPGFWITPRITHQFSNDITFIFVFDLVEACDSFPLQFENVDYKCLQAVFIKIDFLDFLWSNDHGVLMKTWAGPCIAPWSSAWLPILYLYLSSLWKYPDYHWNYRKQIEPYHLETTKNTSITSSFISFFLTPNFLFLYYINLVNTDWSTGLLNGWSSFYPQNKAMLRAVCVCRIAAVF